VWHWPRSVNFGVTPVSAERSAWLLCPAPSACWAAYLALACSVCALIFGSPSLLTFGRGPHRFAARRSRPFPGAVVWVLGGVRRGDTGGRFPGRGGRVSGDVERVPWGVGEPVLGG